MVNRRLLISNCNIAFNKKLKTKYMKTIKNVLLLGSLLIAGVIAQETETRKILTESDGNTLQVSLEKGYYHNIRIKVEVTYKSLDAIDKSGSGNLSCESDLSSAGDFDLNSSGSGNITIKGKIKAAGQASISRSGSGNMKLTGLQAEG